MKGLAQYRAGDKKRGSFQHCTTRRPLGNDLDRQSVDPPNIIGCSKRICELLVQDLAANACALGNRAQSLKASVVRFGNVINSAGSVIPLFKEQIRQGGPVTVTHPAIERYFMSIREAVRLVLTAGVLGSDGSIYILDMGKPIRILDVAKKMLALYGRRDIEIVFTGLRPGEKLTESLTSESEERERTQFKKVTRTLALPRAKGMPVLDWVNTIEAGLNQLSDEKIAELLGAFVGYRKAPTSDKDSTDSSECYVQ